MSQKERIIFFEDGKLEIKEFENSNEIGSVTLFPEDDKKNWESSEAYFEWNGTTISPVIEIGESTIWVYHQVTGGGYLRGTRLTGPNGNYYFTAGNRSYNVTPGRYSHSVDGHIGGYDQSSRVSSGIRYKKPRKP